MNDDRKKTTFEKTLIGQICVKFSAKLSQHELNVEFVKKGIRSDVGSIGKRIITLKLKGLAHDPASAIKSIVENSEKGFGFEPLISAYHTGAGPGHWSYFGVKGGKLKANDSEIDLVTYFKKPFSNKIERKYVQAKCSFREAVKAVNSGKYRYPVIVTGDDYPRLARHSNPKIREAIQNGGIVKTIGGSEVISSKEVKTYTRNELERRLSGKKIPIWRETVREVGLASAIGGGIRGFISAVVLTRQKNGPLTKNDLKKIASDVGSGAVESGVIIGLARGSEKYLLRKNIVRSGGRWLGRTTGAFASLIFSTVTDGVHVVKGKISRRNFAVNLAKNGTVAVCAAFSGPLGLAASLVISAREALIQQKTYNIQLAEQSFSRAEVHAQNFSKTLEDMRNKIDQSLEALIRHSQREINPLVLPAGTRGVYEVNN
ncbi:MAG: hypothetical protein EBQ92_14330 [Proteobacteria bacterium]|nr:hypothetical protein [Pseudomonadota bacterium]